MSDKPAQTGVRSLLAKFESNISDSPPSRGRSPIGADGSGTRPLSKVRASFIPVERNGSAGSPLGWLRKTDTGDSPVNTKPTGIHEFGGLIDRASPLTATVPAHTLPSKQPASTPEKDRPADSTTTVTDAPNEVLQGLGAILKGSPFEDSKPPTPVPMNGSPPRTLGSAVPEPKKVMVPETKKSPPPKENIPPKKPAVSQPKVASSRPAKIMIAKDLNRTANDSTLRSPRTPAPQTPKLPMTPDSQLRSGHANSPAVARGLHMSSPRVNSPKQSARSALSPAAQTRHAAPARENGSRPGSKNTSPDQHKARPKSPTRPIRLPTSMTAPTTSSAAKTSNPSSRPSSRNDANATKPVRKASSLRPDRGAAGPKPTGPAKAVRQQPSRGSLAPQSSTAHDRPKSRTSNVNARAPDDSFLARMMRPTASSASKVHDKVETRSPPRAKKASRPPRKSTEQDLVDLDHPPKAKSSEAEIPITQDTSVEETPKEEPHPIQEPEVEETIVEPLPTQTPVLPIEEEKEEVLKAQEPENQMDTAEPQEPSIEVPQELKPAENQAIVDKPDEPAKPQELKPDAVEEAELQEPKVVEA
ncbi:hypothetical protein LOZ58_003211 [Ophidiomyces ophidiicola]|nr:hypothetical protein LOZ58_003211 [Ophidiomyces ophidiicola]